MKQILLTLIFIALSLVNAHSVKVSDQPTRIIRVGAFNYYPGIFLDKDKEVKGFIVDILKQIAEEENWKLEFNYDSWQKGLERIKNNELDLLTSVAYTKDRANYLDYSNTEILTVWSEVYTPDNSNIESILSLAGKKLAVMKGDYNGSNLKKLLESFNIKTELIEYDSFESIFKSIDDNEVDAGVVNNSYGLAKRHEYNLKSTGIVFSPFNIYFAVGKGQNNDILEKINKHLVLWKGKENSPYHKAIHKWSYQNVNLISTTPNWLPIALIIVIATVILLGLFIFLLRKRVQRSTSEIERSEAKVKTLVQSLDDIVFTLDLDQKHTGVYGKWLEQSGLNPEFFLGKTSREILGDKNAEIHIKSNERALKGEAVTYEWESENLGIKSYTQTSLSAIRDKSGNITGVVGVGRDITSLKQIEQELRSERDRIRMIIAGTPYLFFYTQDINGILTFISPSVEQITGYTVEEWKSRTDWFITNNPINEIAKEKSRSHLRGKIDTSTIPLEIKGRDNQIILLEIFETPIFENGLVTGLNGVAHNVTERNNAEINLRKKGEELDNYFNSSLDLLCIANTGGEFVRLNPEWEKVLGLRLDDIEGRNFIEFVHPDDIERTESEIQKLNNNKDILSFVNRFRHKDGSYKWIEWRAKTIGTNVYAVARDITANKKSEEVLKRNEQILRLFVQHTPASIAMFNNEMRYIVASNRYIKDYNLQIQDLTGLSHYEVFPDIPDRWKEIHRRCLAGATEKSDEDLFPRADGRVDAVRWEIHPWYERDGEIGGIILFTEVITEQKRASDAIKESEALFKMIFESSPYAIALTDLESGRYYNVNNSFIKMLGYAEDEVIGNTSPQLGVWLNPDDREKFIQNIEDDGLIDGKEFRFRVKDGQIIDTRVTARFLTINNKKYLLSIIDDITERKKNVEAIKQSREMLAKLAEQVPGVVYQYRLFPDGSSAFPYSSPGMISIYGVTPEEVREDATPVFGRLHPDDYDYIVSSIQESARNLSLYHSEYRVILPEIGVRWRLCDAKPERLEDGSILWYGIITDITERKLTEAELDAHRNQLEELVKIRTIELDEINLNLKKEIELKIEAEKQLEQALEKEKELNLIKSRFISTASHEFRTPLTSMLTSAEMIQRYLTNWTEEKINDHLDRIKKSISHLTKIMDDVIMINRADSNKVAFNPIELDLYRLCEKIIDDLHIKSNEKIQFIFSFNSPNKIFKLDAKQTELILHNLLSNAIKYSPSGGRVELKIEFNSERLLFSVQDEGIGIPLDDQSRLFETFHRAQNATDIQGTGLGLSIVKHAVDLHRGEIKVNSEEGRGSIFLVSFPMSI